VTIPAFGHCPGAERGNSGAPRSCLETVDAPSIRSKMDDVVAKYGPWTAHNIHLGEDIYTIVPGIEGDNEFRLQRIVQIVSDLSPQPLDELRVLDLGCLEGLFAVEFARRGADVVGLEGREANIAKARFAKDVLELGTLELVLDDIRNLSRAKYGEFDVVLCLGVLYHFDAPAVFGVLEHVADVCRGFAIVETHISTTRRRSFGYRGRTYWGSTLDEPASSASEHDRRILWSSLGNRRSVLLTRVSLCNALVHSGFTTVFENHMPVEGETSPDWVTLLAVKRARQRLLSAPAVDDQPWLDLPEETWLISARKHVRVLFKSRVWYQATNSPVYHLLRRLLPERLRRALVRIVS
jgi:2-polyprenyl-3-methyl-5-hydroxy-6-metoxy-1,4-benzoquinol methylase